MTRRLLLLSVAALALPSLLRAGPELQALRAIALQDAGRIKPLDTFARETARRVTGARAFGPETVGGLDAVEWIVAMLADPAKWREERFIRIPHAGLRAAISLPAGRDEALRAVYSFREIASQEAFLKAAEEVHAKLEQDPEAVLDPLEREVRSLSDALSTVAAVFSGEALKIVPHPTDALAPWYSIADFERVQAAPVPEIRLVTAALVVAYNARDSPSLEAAALALNQRLHELAPAPDARARVLRTEVHYNTLKPFRLASVLYLFGFVVLLASFPLVSTRLGALGLAFVVAGFLIHAYGMMLRVDISGRPPVTNMYESVVWVAWGAVLFALVFEAMYRVLYFATAAAPLALLGLVLADSVPILDAAIDPLVPVLRDNFWLTVHVLTITLGYAAYTLALGLGHLNLGLHLFAPGKVELRKALSLFLYRALQAGTLFLAVGTLLGGVWASYSWGRFWGWDPKETWALIALLGYLALLHGRMIGWFRDFGLAVGAILGYLGVLMAWYGVNFVLGTGLHSYGFGSGGQTYVLGFVAFEVLVVAAALLRRRLAPKVARTE
jgi:cytochrome c-type biogenesis protein CcsB